MILCFCVRFVMCKVSMCCRKISGRMLEDGAHIANLSF